MITIEIGQTFCHYHWLLPEHLSFVNMVFYTAVFDSTAVKYIIRPFGTKDQCVCWNGLDKTFVDFLAYKMFE